MELTFLVQVVQTDRQTDRRSVFDELTRMPREIFVFFQLLMTFLPNFPPIYSVPNAILTGICDELAVRRLNGRLKFELRFDLWHFRVVQGTVEK
jgi:hypothetical protein